jgi:heptosyltransferase III
VGSILECLPRGSRVAVIRLRSLGDCVLTTPALDILKRARPDLEIAVAVEDRFRAIFELNPDAGMLAPTWRAVRSFQPALCLNFHGGTRSAWMTALSGAPHRAGFAHFRHQWAYNLYIPRAQQILGEERTVHTAEHLASAMFWLGAPRVEVPRARFSLQKLVQPPVPPYAIIHAVAAAPEKTWNAAGFLEVAAHLRRSGIHPIFIGAADDNMQPFQDYRLMHGARLSEIRDLLCHASLFVGNDSGPAHMAAAWGVPVVAIFGSSNPAIWGPWRTPSEVVTSPHGVAGVTTAQVLEALARLGVHA